MNVLIIGENKHNSYICDYFAQKRITPVIISDVFSLRSLVGEFGDFTAHLKSSGGKDECISTDFVVLTEQPTAEPVLFDGVVTYPLYGEKEFFVSANIAVSEPVVFMLDHICESPLSATISALEDAVIFARNKRKVFYLSKFVRTAGCGIEALYRDARDAGVTFIKYVELKVSADLKNEIFSIVVSDGELESIITTKSVYADGGRDSGERFSYVAKMLNLNTNEHGHLTEDTFFLTPALTGRRGVFHLTRDLVAERLDEGLDYIYTSASNCTNNISSHGIAVIDGNKCVFCYTCYRACTHAALQPDHLSSQMQCLTVACYGCGTCAGLCPASAIVLENDAASTADGYDSKKVLVLCCENSGGANFVDADDIDVLTVPCGGLIDMRRLTEGLDAYDKIMAVVCPTDACRHFNGNKRACAQVKRLQEMMKSAGLRNDKVHIIQASHAMPRFLEEEFTSFLLLHDLEVV